MDGYRDRGPGWRTFFCFFCHFLQPFIQPDRADGWMADGVNSLSLTVLTLPRDLLVHLTRTQQWGVQRCWDNLLNRTAAIMQPHNGRWLEVPKASQTTQLETQNPCASVRNKRHTDQNDQPLKTPLDISEREKTERAKNPVQKRIKDRKDQEINSTGRNFRNWTKIPNLLCYKFSRCRHGHSTYRNCHW